jgi:hypothetical protein
MTLEELFNSNTCCFCGSTNIKYFWYHRECQNCCGEMSTSKKNFLNGFGSFKYYFNFNNNDYISFDTFDGGGLIFTKSIEREVIKLETIESAIEYYLNIIKEYRDLEIFE